MNVKVSPLILSLCWVSDTAGNIHIGGGYGDVASGADWGGMLYISGPADEIVNVIQKHPHMPTG